MVIGAKPRADYVNSDLVAFSDTATAAEFRHSVAGRQIMLHLRARGFAPLTVDGMRSKTVGARARDTAITDDQIGDRNKTIGAAAGQAGRSRALT
jgi:predicted secreted protein